jgi:hypothetical protein
MSMEREASSRGASFVSPALRPAKFATVVNIDLQFWQLRNLWTNRCRLPKRINRTARVGVLAGLAGQNAAFLEVLAGERHSGH